MTSSVVDSGATLRDLAQQYAHRLAGTARVDQVYGQGVRVRLRPTRPGAVEAGWGDVGGELEVVVAGRAWQRVGGRAPDAELVRELCEAVVAGHGHEVVAPGRVLVTLTPDGGPPIRLVSRTGWAGVVPLPGWTRWGRRTPYAPY